MNIPKEIIEKAIEGRWCAQFLNPERLVACSWTYDGEYLVIATDTSIMLRKCNAEIALSSEFWQALGKALNWGRHMNWCRWETSACEYRTSHFYCPHPEHRCNCHSSMMWQIKAESFFNRIMIDMPLDTFWKEILNN